jgi:acetyl-CoA carboxylase carboxyltransferase component
MKLVIRWLGDGGEFFEIQPHWAKNVVIGFMRLGGFPVGVIANQPLVLGGALDIDAADKAAHFISLSDAFGIPLLFLHDCPGFMVGSRMEHLGIIRHGAKMLHAMGLASVPKLSIVIRKSAGAGYYAMCGKGFHPDFLAAWPGAEISLMSREGAESIVGSSRETGRTTSDLRLAAEALAIDDIIDPRETVPKLIGHLKTLVPIHENYRVQLKSKKHGVSPV